MTTLLSGYSKRFMSSVAAFSVTLVEHHAAMDDIGLGSNFELGSVDEEHIVIRWLGV